jgi:hypothetical protein
LKHAFSGSVQESVGLEEIRAGLFQLISHQRTREHAAISVEENEESPTARSTDVITSSWTDSEQLESSPILKKQPRRKSKISDPQTSAETDELPSFLKPTNELTDPNEQSDPPASDSEWPSDIDQRPSEEPSGAEHARLVDLIVKEREARRKLHAGMPIQADSQAQPRSFSRKPRKKTEPPTTRDQPPDS